MRKIRSIDTDLIARPSDNPDGGEPLSPSRNHIRAQSDPETEQQIQQQSKQ